MKNIHILGAGGVAGIGMTRCLADAYDVTGSDESQWSFQAMEAEGRDSEPVPDLYLPIPDSLVGAYAGASERYFLPPWMQVNLCQDKAETAEMLGSLAPKTYWLRDTHGAGAKGAQMIAEYLPGRNFSQEFVFFKGNLLAGFQKERLSYLVKRREPMATVSGSSAVSVCTDDQIVRETALSALLKLEKATETALHGFYGVDLRMDELHEPKVTEINAGRLLTASYSHFWLTGYNLPMVGVAAALGDEPFTLPEYPVGWGVIRQTDQLPQLFSPEITATWHE